MIKLVIKIIAIIFFTEFVVMAGVISMAAEIGTMGQILIDSAVLAIISGSLIYVYGVKPYTIGRSEQLKEIVETRNQLKSANIELEFLKHALDEHAIVSITDVHGKIIYANDKFCQISGYSRSELIGQNHRILSSGAHSKAFFVDLWKTISTGNTWQGEIENRTKAGKSYWLSATIVPSLNEKGKPYQYVAIRTDITKQKEITNQLKSANIELEFQKHALDEHAIVSITDVHGKIIYANDKFCQISGYSRSELIGQNHRILSSGAHSKAFFVDLWKTISTGNTWQGEIENRTKAGKSYWLSATIVPSLNEKGKPYQYVAIRTDITKQKEITNQLKSANIELEFQKHALDEHAIVSITDVHGKIIYANDKFCQISGYSRSELIGQNHRILSSGAHSKAFFVDLWKTISTGNTWQGEIENRTKAGKSYWLSATIVPSLNEKGKPYQYVAIRTDITKQKEITNQLKSANIELEFQKHALDEHAIVSITDVHGKIIYANDKFCQISGYSRSELIGQNHRILSSGAHSKAFFVDLWKTISTGNTWQGEIENRTKAGKSYWLSATIVPSLNEKGKPYQYVAIRTDITKQKEITNQLEKTSTLETEARMQAENANKAKSEFLAAMSHDLRTPLNAIMGFSEIIQAEMYGKLGDEKYKEYSTHIHQSGELLINLINDILDLAKVEAGKYELHEEIQDIPKLISRSCLQLKQMAIQEGVTVEKRMNEAHSFLLGDERVLMQILNNLISNAIKFTQKGGLIIVTSDVDTSTGRYIICVEDTGIGMSRVEINKVLEPFGQIDSYQARRHEGTGLGLHLCVNFIKLFGGELNIESQVGVGTKVSISFPSERTIQNPKIPAEH